MGYGATATTISHWLQLRFLFCRFNEQGESVHTEIKTLKRRRKTVCLSVCLRLFGQKQKKLKWPGVEFEYLKEKERKTVFRIYVLDSWRPLRTASSYNIFLCLGNSQEGVLSNLSSTITILQNSDISSRNIGCN